MLQITYAQQHAPFHFILHLQLNRTGGSTHLQRRNKTRSIRNTKRDHAATTSNQKQHRAHLQDCVHP